MQGERIVGREQLIFVFHIISKLIFRADPNYQEKFYNEFLSEKADVNEGEYVQARIPAFDDINRKLFLEDAIQEMARHETELHNIYNAYVIENYFALKKNHRILLNSREIALQNKKWSFTSFILYLKESETTPHLTTIDNLEETLKQIVPSVSSKQQEFYSRHIIVDTYQKETEQYFTNYLGTRTQHMQEIQESYFTSSCFSPEGYHGKPTQKSWRKRTSPKSLTAIISIFSWGIMTVLQAPNSQH